MTVRTERPRSLNRLRSLNTTGLLVGVAVLIVALAVAGYVIMRWLTAPSSPGEATFTAGAATTTTEASQFCDVHVVECRSNPTASAVLRVPAGTPLEVTVPAAVASTPWQLAFSFRDASGAQQQGRSPVFGPDARSTFTLILPGAPGAPPAQLESAEVQQYGARLSEGQQGVQFSTRATWVLSVDDR